MMKLVLDTHAFLWWAIEPGKLSPDVLTKCQDSTTDLMLSVVSVWEIIIKVQLGKLGFASTHTRLDYNATASQSFPSSAGRSEACACR